jgi:hypothetical protein
MMISGKKKFLQIWQLWITLFTNILCMSALDYLLSPSEENLQKEITGQIILLTPNFLDCDVQFLRLLPLQ